MTLVNASSGRPGAARASGPGRRGQRAVSHNTLGRPDDTLPLDLRALAITEAALGPDHHPSTALQLDNLGSTYLPGAAGRRSPIEAAGAGDI
jgi:hypothetical protein